MPTHSCVIIIESILKERFISQYSVLKIVKQHVLPLKQHGCTIQFLVYKVRSLKFATSKALVNSMKKTMLCLKLGIFQFKKA